MKIINRLIGVWIALFLFIQTGIAGEGMWLPLLLKALNEKEMQSMGMKMTAEDIYSVNKGSLKDAIVHFNRGCTGEIISDQGLLLTNHHCGYSQIQSHSTVEDNYLKNGFWAMSLAEEKPNPNLVVVFLQRMEDVTEAVMNGLEGLTGEAREQQLKANIERVKSGAELSKHEEIEVKSFYGGNAYYALVTKTYTDVRLVGAPPEAVGKFGSDTDNWVWPRHTGDFSLFRIYAGPDNEPATYSPDNKPYKPKHFLPVSLDGVEEDDFTLVFGYPGRTQEYLPAVAVEQVIESTNPARIEIRDQALKIMDRYMRADEKTRLQYASKFARIANYWKKWIGEKTGLEKTGAVAKKVAFEKEFVNKLNGDRNWQNQYGNILPQFEKLYSEVEPYSLAADYYYEIVGRNVEILRMAGYFDRLVNMHESGNTSGFTNYQARLSRFVKNFHKNYRAEIDQEVMSALLKLYAENVPFETATAPVKMEMKMQGAKDYEQLASALFGKSILTNQAKMETAMTLAPDQLVKMIQDDPIYQFSKSMRTAFETNVQPELDRIEGQIGDLQKTYMKALIEVFPDKRFYPDANSTMRVTYGNVKGYTPRDAVYYEPVSYLSGVMEKYVPGDYEFDVPEKLIELYQSKDYGDYGVDGKMPVCFLGSNHTTGGNSGSPAIDAHGNLIGLNFDRVWEGTMSDINYDVSLCRNIMVDARYILFIVDKYAGAKHLIEEMKLVHPKKK